MRFIKYNENTKLFSLVIQDRLFHSKKNRGNAWKNIKSGMGTREGDRPMYIPVDMSNRGNNMPYGVLQRMNYLNEYGSAKNEDYTQLMPNLFHHYTPISNIKPIIKSGKVTSGSTFNVKDDMIQHMDQSELLNKPMNVSGSYYRSKQHAAQSVPSGEDAKTYNDGGKVYWSGLYPLSPEERAQAQIKDIDSVHRINKQDSSGKNSGRDKLNGKTYMSHKPIMRVNMSLPDRGYVRMGEDLDEVVINRPEMTEQSISIPKGALNSQYMSKNQIKKFRRYLKNHRSMVEADKYTLEQLLGTKSPHLKNIEESYGY